MSNSTQENDPKLQALNAEKEKIQKEIEQLYSSFPSVDLVRQTPEEIGSQLLDAYLNDLPFSSYAFALQPIKCAFIDAALKTYDAEIITCSLFLVKQTLTAKSFNALIESQQRYKEAYEAIMPRKTSQLIRYNKSNPVTVRKSILNQEKNGASDLMQLVINDEIKRIEKNDETIGTEIVDQRWTEVCKCCREKRYNAIDVDTLVKKKGLISHGWKSAMSPYQSAILTAYWGCPRDIVLRFAQKTSDKVERAKLQERGLL